jgi:hypothetical protein
VAGQSRQIKPVAAMREFHAKVREIFPFSLPHGLLEAENVTA